MIGYLAVYDMKCVCVCVRACAHAAYKQGHFLKIVFRLLNLRLTLVNFVAHDLLRMSRLMSSSQFLFSVLFVPNRL